MRTLQTELVDKGLAKKRKSVPKKCKHKKERLSTRDIEELMGIKRETYKRVNGAFRRK